MANVVEEKIKFSELRRHFMIPDMPTCVPSSTFSDQELAIMNDRQRPFQRRLEMFEDGHDPVFLLGSRYARYLGLYRDWETDRKSTRLNSSHRL